MPKERGPERDFVVKWAFDMEYGGCSRFWWGGTVSTTVINTPLGCPIKMFLEIFGDHLLESERIIGSTSNQMHSFMAMP